MNPITHLLRPRPGAAAQAVTHPPAEGIHYDYQAIKAAAFILRDCRLEAECYLACKRATVAIGVAGRLTKEALVTAAALGGAAVGSIVPVAGTFAGGYLAGTAADKIIPGYNLSPDTHPGNKIDKVSRGGLHPEKLLSASFYVRNGKSLLIDEVGNRLINRALDASGTATPPVAVPIAFTYQNGKDLLKVKSVSKQDVVRQLLVGVDNAEQVMLRLDSKIRHALASRGRLRQYHAMLCMPSGPREVGVEVINHPTNPAHWVRQSRYERHYADAQAELQKLKRFLRDASVRLLVQAKEATA